MQKIPPGVWVLRLVGLLASVATLFSGLAAGTLWDQLGATATFGITATVSFAATILLAVGRTYATSSRQ